MVSVLLLVNEDWNHPSEPGGCAAGEVMVTALKQAIASSSTPCDRVQLHFIHPGSSFPDVSEDTILCPLTVHLPPHQRFSLYETCRQVESLRTWVQHTFTVETGDGDLWLPIVLTAKGSLYGEVIGTHESTLPMASSPSVASDRPPPPTYPYVQPLHLPDPLRRPLYRLGGQILRSLSAPPSVYLLQFSFAAQGIRFDRLFPFPERPAIASLGVQAPDLFACYWRCLTHQPILDLTIPNTVPYYSRRSNA